MPCRECCNDCSDCEYEECSFHSDGICENAIRNDHYDCFISAFNQGRYTECIICTAIPFKNDDKYLIFLHENLKNFKWSSSLCYTTVQNNNSKCLQYALENGCPYNKNAIKLALERKEDYENIEKQDDYIDCYELLTTYIDNKEENDDDDDTSSISTTDSRHY